jgi:hypothetical protein
MPDFIETPDFLNASTALRDHGAARVQFDPSRQSHLDSFDSFLRTGNWGEIQFLCEAPYTDVPMTVLMKFALYEQSIVRETPEERAIRFGTMNLVIPAKRETRDEKEARLAAVNQKIADALAAN